jgi:hypothetical protein
MTQIRPSECEHSWQKVEVHCEVCGSHPGLCCPECHEIRDLIFEDDSDDA